MPSTAIELVDFGGAPEPIAVERQLQIGEGHPWSFRTAVSGAEQKGIGGNHPQLCPSATVGASLWKTMSTLGV